VSDAQTVVCHDVRLVVTCVCSLFRVDGHGADSDVMLLSHL